MMGAVRIFNPLPMAELPVEAIFSRLKFRPSQTRLTSQQREEVLKELAEAKSLLDLKGAFRRMQIKVGEKETILETGEVMESRHLALMLKDCREALFLAATAGKRVTDEIGRLMEEGNLARAAIYDAVASETTDAALDWLTKIARQELIREGKSVSDERYSPGYGDLTLENQEIICRLLGLDKLGITLSEKFILLPEKTVTAIAGIK